MKRSYFTRWRDRNGWGFMLWSGNGRELMNSRHYAHARSAWRALRNLQADFMMGEALDVYDSDSLQNPF